MKNILFVLSAVAILASCTTPANTEETKPTGDSTSTTTVTTPSVDTAKVDTAKSK
jgi:uncharacterized lipoprotein YajG